MQKPIEWSRARSSELKSLRGVCLDIDDTLSSEGKLTAEAYAALEALTEAGFWVVPVTGRPAGWCDHIARFWPVRAVVGENGAFHFYMKGGKLCRGETMPQAASLERLTALKRAVIAEFPDAQWASDQAYRLHDLAIDVAEDLPRGHKWSKERIQSLLALCERQGAHAKLSSIHVNAWYGDYDKRSGFEAWLRTQAPRALQDHAKWLYIGDSPNDEPMFEVFENSVGVANLKRYLNLLKHPPRWITKGKSGTGFVEMARRLTATSQARSKATSQARLKARLD